MKITSNKHFVNAIYYKIRIQLMLEDAVLISVQPNSDLKFSSGSLIRSSVDNINSYYFIKQQFDFCPIFAFKFTKENFSYKNLQAALFEMPTYEDSTLLITSYKYNKPYVQFEGDYYNWCLFHETLNTVLEDVPTSFSEFPTAWADTADLEEVDFDLSEEFIQNNWSSAEKFTNYLNAVEEDSKLIQVILSRLDYKVDCFKSFLFDYDKLLEEVKDIESIFKGRTYMNSKDLTAEKVQLDFKNEHFIQYSCSMNSQNYTVRVYKDLESYKKKYIGDERLHMFLPMVFAEGDNIQIMEHFAFPTVGKFTNSYKIALLQTLLYEFGMTIEANHVVEKDKRPLIISPHEVKTLELSEREILYNLLLNLPNTLNQLHHKTTDFLLSVLSLSKYSELCEKKLDRIYVVTCREIAYQCGYLDLKTLIEYQGTEEFYHVTYKDALESIEKQGLIKVKMLIRIMVMVYMLLENRTQMHRLV